MTRDVRDTLASQFDSYEIRRQIHDVPPHEVYEVVVDGRRAVFKHDTGPTGNAAVEGAVTAFVGERTSVPVPAILAIGPDYYVAPWHPDAPDPDDSFDVGETWSRAAGRGLATLHEETASHFDEYGEFRARGYVSPALEVDGHEDWHAGAIAYVREHRPVLAKYGHADVADAVVEFLTGHPEAVAGAGEPVCCHGWATPEHVGVQDDRVACVVDFEHARVAPGEFDYWRTVFPTFGDDDPRQRAFRNGYESVRTLPDGFEERRPLYVVLNLVYYFESLYVQDQHDTDATTARATRMREQVFETLDRLS